MKKLLCGFSVIATVLALNIPMMVLADEALPEIAPVEEVAPASLESTTAPDPDAGMAK